MHGSVEHVPIQQTANGAGPQCLIIKIMSQSGHRLGLAAFLLFNCYFKMCDGLAARDFLKKRVLPKFILDVADYAQASNMYFVQDENLEIPLYFFKKLLSGRTWISVSPIRNKTVLLDIVKKETFARMFTPILFVSFLEIQQSLQLIKYISGYMDVFDEVIWLTFREAQGHLPESNLTLSAAHRVFVASPWRPRSSGIDVHYLYQDYSRNRIKDFHLAIWKNEKGKFFPKIDFHRCCYNVTGLPINAVYVKNGMPDTIVQKVNGNGWKITGIIGEIFNEAVKTLGIKYGKMYGVDVYGSFDEKTNGTGVFRELFYKRADVAVALLQILPERVKAVDFSIDFYRSPYSAIYKAARDEDWIFHLTPFTLNLWITIGSSYISLMAIIVLMRCTVFSAIDRNMNVFYSFGALLNQGEHKNIQSIGWRVCHYSLLVFGSVIITLYGDKVLSHQTVKVFEDDITCIADLAHSNTHYPVMLRDSAFFHILKNSKDSEYRIMWDKIKDNIDAYLYNNEAELMDHFEKGGALMDDIFFLVYWKSVNPNLTLVRRTFLNVNNAIAFQKHSPLRRVFNNVLMDMSESGIMIKIANKYFDWKVYEAQNTQKAISSKIVFQQTLMPMLVLLTGIVVCLTTLTVEIILKRMK